jgi:glucoamylase
VWDLPKQTVKRYLEERKTATFQIWTTNQRRAWLAPGKNLRIDVPAPAGVHWTINGQTKTATTSDAQFGLFSALLPLSYAPSGSKVDVTITPEHPTGQWKGDSFTIQVR